MRIAVHDKENLLASALVAGIIFLSSDALLGGTVSVPSLLIARLLLYGVCCANLALLVFLNAPRVSLSVMGATIVVWGLGITAAINQDSSWGYAYQLSVVGIAAFLSHRYDLRLYLDRLSACMLVVASGAMCLYLIGNIDRALLDWLPTGTNSSSARYATVAISSIFTDSDSLRSMGVFREAGVFATFLCLAVVNEMHMRERPRPLRTTLFILAIITTFSTAGFVALGLILVATAIAKKSQGGTTWKNRVFSVLGILAFATVALGDAVLPAVLDKLSPDSATYGSSLARIISLEVGVSLAMLAPMFGVGLAGYESAFANYALAKYGVAFTSSGHSANTLMSVLGTYGIPLFLLLLYSVFRLVVRLTSGTASRSLLFGAFLVLLGSQDFRYSPGILSLLFFAFGRKSGFGSRDGELNPVTLL
jgi:hypothetical protein